MKIHRQNSGSESVKTETRYAVRVALTLGVALGWAVSAFAQAPEIISANSLDGATIGVCFSVSMAANAGDEANYTLTGGATVNEATLRANTKQVELKVTGLTGNTFTLTVKNVQDTAGNTIAANTAVIGIVEKQLAAAEIGGAAGGSVFSCEAGKYEITGGGYNLNDNAGDNTEFLYETLTGDFDRQVRITNIVASVANENWARGGLMMRENLEPLSRNLTVVAGNPRSSESNQIAVYGRMDDITGYGDFGRHYANVRSVLPNQWLRLKRVGNYFGVYVSRTGTNWTLIADKYYTTLASTVMVGMYAAAANQNGTTLATVIFENYGDATPADVTPPSLVSVGTLDKKIIGVRFSETMDSVLATTPGNFQVSGATVTNAVMGIGGDSVYLQVSGLTAETFTVTVSNVKDSAGNVIPANSIANGKMSNWKAEDIGSLADPANRPTDGDDPYVVGQSVAVSSGNNPDLEVIGGGSNFWNAGDFGHFIYQQRTGNFDVQVAVERFDRAPNTASFGHGGIMVREYLYQPDVGDYTADGTKVRLVMNTTYPEGNQERTAIAIWRDTVGGGYANGNVIGTDVASGGIVGRFGRLRASTAAGTIPANTSPTAARWLRVKRVGNLFTSYYSYDGVRWVQHNTKSLALADTVYVGVAAMTDTAGTNPANYSVLRLHALGDYSPAPVVPGPIRIEPQGDKVVLSWTGSGVLQSAPEVTGAWIDVVGATNPNNVTPTEERNFYRLRSP